MTSYTVRYVNDTAGCQEVEVAVAAAVYMVALVSVGHYKGKSY